MNSFLFYHPIHISIISITSKMQHKKTRIPLSKEKDNTTKARTYKNYKVDNNLNDSLSVNTFFVSVDTLYCCLDIVIKPLVVISLW